MKSRSASLTGATGFLGWHIAEALRDEGWAVRGIVRPGSAKLLPDGVARVESELTADALARAFETTAVVVHAAGQTRGPRHDPFAVNISGTRAAVRAANAVGASIVHISSQAVAGPCAEGMTREDDEPRPITEYGRSKLTGERIVRAEASVPWTILRPAAVYGPRDRGFLAIFRLATRGWFPLATPPGAAFTLIHAHDAARAVARAAVSGANGRTMFVGYPEPVTSEAILEAVAQAVGRPYRPLRLPRLLVGAAAIGGEIAWRLGMHPDLDLSRLAEFQARRFVCATDLARTTIGFVASIPLAEGMRSTWEWYRSHGWA